MPLCEATFWNIFKMALAAGLGTGVAFAPWVIVMDIRE
jgi:hypothetical protein